MNKLITNLEHNQFYYLIYVMCIFITAFFTARFPITPSMSLISMFFIVILALPSFYALVVYTKNKRGVVALIVLSFLAYIIETSAIKTGFPYGSFTYNNTLGLQLFWVTPITVPFAWVPLVVGSYFLAKRVSNSTVELLVTATIVLVVTDLILDPGAVALGFWAYSGESFFYDVPLSNFVGWVFTGFIGVSILHFIVGNHVKQHYSSYLLEWSWYTSVLMWIFIAIHKRLIWVAVIGLILSLIVSYVRKEK
jgi:bisanhydrobacterioruberin hydratase